MQVREFGHARGSETSLALRTGAIQRKRIHSLSTPGTLIALSLIAAVGCAGSGSGGPSSGDRALAADPTVGLSPGESKSVRFVLTSSGVPVAGQTIAFSFVDSSKIASAMLFPPQATTDAAGAATVTVTAGFQTVFSIQGRSGTAPPAVTVVNVAPGGFGSVEVTTVLGSSVSASDVSGIEVLFFDNALCADIDPARPPVSTRSASPLAAAGETTAPFEAVSLQSSSAIIARGLDVDGGVVAAGCVDLAGPSLLPGGVVDVAVALAAVLPDPVGTFDVISWFAFSPPLAAAAPLAAPWRDLSDCPLDPAQLWLDCTIDALSPATDADPLDCVPSTAPGGEGALGDALAARRGTIVDDPSGVLVGCRSGLDASHAVSLEAVLLGLYGAPLPAPIVALPAVANDAAHLLDQVQLTSTFAIQPGSAPSSYLLTHTLETASFGPPSGSPTVTNLLQLGIPVLSTTTSATTQGELLVIARHGFTLRLGAIARAAFGAGSLGRRGLPADAQGLVDLLAGLAHTDGGATGCDAMDAALCPLVGYPAGCLAAACNAGRDALAARLDAAFDAADGTGLDFYLSGSAPMLLDRHGNGTADALGTKDDQSQIAIWSADLRTSLGRSTVAGTFAASHD
jgi:hypothetical protein